jgi:hypothetical protein
MSASMEMKFAIKKRPWNSGRTVRPVDALVTPVFIIPFRLEKIAIR